MSDRKQAKRTESEGAKPVGITRRGVIVSAVAAGVGAALTPLLSGCAARAKEAADTTTNESAAPAPTTPPPPGAVPVTLNINGKTYTQKLEPRVTLLDALREHIGLTGSKKGCDHGQCGACTVLIDDRRVNSCLTLAIAASGKKITTVEGLANGEQLHPVQQAFIEHDAFQCGYCTPGQICSAVGLIHEGHAKSPDEIRELMSGNICRCGAYPNIVKAVIQAMST